MLFEGSELSVVLIFYYCRFEDRDFYHNVLKGLKGAYIVLLTKFLE